MKKLFAGLIAAVFTLASLGVAACPAEKAKGEKQMSAPAKPKA